MMDKNAINRYKNSWQDLRYVNGTLEEWVKKSDDEIAVIEAEIRAIRDLLGEG
jgi:hypothetical protein